MATQQFENIGVKIPAKGKFDLSYEKKFTGDMGYLYPILCELMLPGDVWNVGVNVIARMQPLVAPVLHRMDIKIEYFAVPLRKLCYQSGEVDEDAWESFITGGEDGDDTTTLDRWTPTGAETDPGSLWDYFGWPITDTPGTPFVPTGTTPLAFPLYAYNKIWNEWYRAEHIQEERAYNDSSKALRNRPKDYFTAALPWQELGDPMAIGTDIIGLDRDITMTGDINTPTSGVLKSTTNEGVRLDNFSPMTSGEEVRWNDPALTGAGFDIHDLRLSKQVQKWKELNARAGVRLTEYLQAHFNVRPQDSRLQRSEYLGGTQMPLMVSEVLQTSRSDTGEDPLGTMGGHGITGGDEYICKYRAEEHMIIIGLLSIVPENLYQQGINRQWLYENRYDWPNPMFVNLSEQEVYQAEIYATNGDAEENETVFGFIGRYDEHRVKHSMVCGGMREDFDHWHISEQYASAPTLNSSFIECDPRKDIFAAPSEDGFIISVGNNITAIRPIPTMNVPGNL